MTIEEQFERLRERQEALAQALELMQRMWQDQWAEIHKATSELQIASRQDGENIRALVRIAEIRERRLSRLEGEPEDDNGR